MKNQILRAHLFRHVEEGHIRPHGIAVLVCRPVAWRLTRHAGAVALEGVVDIGVDGRAETLCLPISRNLNFVPTAHVEILTVKFGGSFLRIPTPMKLPFAVERYNLLALLPFRRQLQRGVIRQFVDAQHGRVFPIGGSRSCCSVVRLQALRLGRDGQHGGYEYEKSSQ